MRKFLLAMLFVVLVLTQACSDSAKKAEENTPLVPEQDYYDILLAVFNGAADLPDNFAAILDDSFTPRGLSPLMSLDRLDSGLMNLWLFASSVSDNGFSIIRPGMTGRVTYNVPGSDIVMEMEVEQFLMNVGIHTKAVRVVIDDEPESDIRGILPDGMTINILVGGVPYSIDREWIRQNSYFSAYVLLAQARVIDVTPKENEYPIPDTYSFSKYEIFTYDEDGELAGIYTKPSELVRAISDLTSDNPTLTYQIKVEVTVPADLSRDGTFSEELRLPYSIFGKADISFPLLFNYTSYTTHFDNGKLLTTEGCNFTDPSTTSVDIDTEYYPEGASTWWLPDITPSQIAMIRASNPDAADQLERLLFIDDGERGFDVDWWRDLEILTIVPGLGLSDIGVFASYSGMLGGTYDLAQFNVNGVMDSAENRAIFFDRMFRMNGFRLTDMGNIPEDWGMPYPEDVPAGLMDSVKIDVDAQGNITFGGKYDGPTRLVGVHALADSIPTELKIYFYLNGLVAEGTQYDPSGLEGYSQYISDVHVYLPCSSADSGWQEVNMYQLLQYIGSKWQKGKQAFYSNYFADVEDPQNGEVFAWLGQFTSPTGRPFGNFPKVDKGELAMPTAPFIIKADVYVPEHETTYEGLEILMGAFGGFYTTNFYAGATLGSGLGK